MAKDPQEVQRRILAKGKEDAEHRVGEAQSALGLLKKQQQKLDAEVKAAEAELEDAQEELDAIAGLVGEPIVDPGA